MKFRNLYLLVLLCTLSCSKKDAEHRYSVYTSYEYEANNIITSKEKLEINTSSVEGQYKVEYCDKKGCVKYILSTNSEGDNKYISLEGDTLNLIFGGKSEYLINGESYPIYKYLLNPLIIDGETQHFWSPQLGILLIKSSTWKSFKHLSETSQRDKTVLNPLLMILLNDRNMILEDKPDSTFKIDDELNEMIEEELEVVKDETSLKDGEFSSSKQLGTLSATPEGGVESDNMQVDNSVALQVFGVGGKIGQKQNIDGDLRSSDYVKFTESGAGVGNVSSTIIEETDKSGNTTTKQESSFTIV